MRQLPLQLSFRAAYGREDFFVSACNAQAVALLDRWPDWPAFALRLQGAPGSGKTHLLQVWKARSGARVIAGADLGRRDGLTLMENAPPAVAVDDAQSCPDPAALLHIYNICREANVPLVLSLSSEEGGVWRSGLRDLDSRLAATPHVALGRPDEALLAALLVKQLADRRLDVAPEVIAYILPRLERSFAAVRACAAALDAESLSSHRRVTIPLAARVLMKH